MYRLISASQDAYIQNKLIKNVRCTDANTGQAGTMDLFSLYNETYVPAVSGTYTTASIRELSRLLIKFNYDELQQLTSSILDLNDPSFKVYLSMKDVYGGQTVPSNYTLDLYPLAKNWNEGRGSDVISFRHVDVCNFLTASVENTTYVTWSLEGANASGSLPSGSNVDIWNSGNLGLGSQSLLVTQFFPRGDEDLWMDVTSLVSASVAGTMENNGFRISYTEDEELAAQTFFVKRFGTRHAYNGDLKPLLHVYYSGERIEDETELSHFGPDQQTFFVYNKNTSGNYTNFISASNSIVSGSDCIILQLAASHSIEYTTQSYSISHSASISHLTRSMDTFTAYFTGSQHVIGSVNQTGIYSCSFELNPETTASLLAFLSGATEHDFKISWKSLDDSITYASTYQKFQYNYGDFSNVTERNFVVNITNLRYEYQTGDKVRLRIFAQDYDSDLMHYKLPTKSKSVIIPNMFWRIRKAYENIVVIPWQEDATKLSYDSEGMFFDLWTSDFDINIIYQIDFLIKSDSTGKDLYIENPGFRFKVVE